MEMNRNKIFKPLINQTITKLERLTVLDNEDNIDDSEALSDTLFLSLSNGTCFEILVTSENTVLKEITNKEDLLVSFSLEDDEKIDFLPIYEKINVPFTIASVTETWADKSNPLLVAVDFLDLNKQSLLSILTETDEIDILKSEKIKIIVQRMVFAYGSIYHKWYDS